MLSELLNLIHYNIKKTYPIKSEAVLPKPQSCEQLYNVTSVCLNHYDELIDHKGYKD